MDAVDDDPDAEVLAGRVALPLEPGLDDDRDRVRGLGLDPLDPPAQLARGPERVDQLEVVVRQKRREQRPDSLERSAPGTGDLWGCAYFRHRRVVPLRTNVKRAFNSPSTGPRARPRR